MRRFAVPESTESRANERAERFFIDMTGPFHATSSGVNRYAMLYVDDFTRFKFIRFLKHKTHAAKELRKLVAEHIARSGIKIGTVRTDGGGELEGEFQSILKELVIKRETTPPHAPQYNGVVERALGLLRDKTVALLRGMTAGKSDRLWAEAMNYACEMLNCCTTASFNHGVSPYELWVGHRPKFDHLSRLEPSATCGDPNPSTSWRHAGPGASCSTSTLTTRDEPSASTTSPSAKPSCARPSYGTSQPTPERQFPVTRRLSGEGGATRALSATTQENLRLHVLTGKPEGRLDKAGIGTAPAGGGE